MKKIYKNIADKILINKPFLWIIGWHKFLPIILFLVTLALIVGIIIPTDVYEYDTPFLTEFSTFLGFLSFLVFVLFVIRQIKFNSFRIHHKIPYKKSITIYFNFLLFILILSIIPFIPLEVYNSRVIKKVNSITNDIDNDIKTLNNNSFFFYIDDDANNEVLYDEQELKQHKIKIKFTNDGLIMNHRLSEFTYKYNDLTYPITISKDEALERIKKFITVSKKYNVKITESNPLVIYNKLKTYTSSKERFYNLLSFNNLEYPYSIHDKYSQYFYHLERYNKYKLHNQGVVYGFLYFASILALLLWIVISVPIADFGYAVLGGTILSIFMGVILAILISFSNSVNANLFLVELIIIIIFFIAFFGDNNSLISRISKILSQLLIPVFIGVLYGFYFENRDYKTENKTEDFMLVILLLSIILTVFIYKNVYKKNRLLPK